MATFVKTTQINQLLIDIIKEAEEQLIFFCPYFKLHDYVQHELKLRINNPRLRIIVVFGKNEHDPAKSMSRDDFEFLKTFPRIDIAYEKRPHAKYYANEKTGVITSLNLHAYSQNNNIEAGVKFQAKSFFKDFTNRTLGGLPLIFQILKT